ncbi:MAG: hypothetical protein M0P13_10145, partial [Fibrobacteraceae bacterium]|nr:hypothetical protein [Fibrobacteraceae bacterium]
ISGISNPVSLATALFKDLNSDGTLDFDIRSNASLTLDSGAGLSFSLVVPLKKSAQATESSSLKEVGLVETETDLEGNNRDVMDLESVLGSSTVKANTAISYGGPLTGDVNFTITKGAIAETATTVSVKFYAKDTDSCKNVASLVTILGNTLSNSGISTIVDEDQGRYLLTCDSEFSLKTATDDDGSTSYETGFRELGLAGVSSKRAFVSDAAIGEKPNLRKIEVSDNASHSVEVNFQGTAEDCASALNAAFATTDGFDGYVASAVSGDLIIVPPSTSSDSLSITFGSLSFAQKYVAFSNTLPIAHPSADIGISFELTRNAVKETEQVTVFADKLKGAQNAADVAAVIQTAIDEKGILKGKVVAEVLDGKIAFRATAFDVKLGVSFGDYTQADDLGFSSPSGLSESGACLSLEFLDATNASQSINIDLRSFFAAQAAGGKSITDMTIGSVLTEIVNQSKTTKSNNDNYIDALKLSYATDLSGQQHIVGIAGNGSYTLESIDNLNGCTLASLLGIAGSRTDGQDFKIKATLTAAQNSIQFRNLQLSIVQTLHGSAALDARYGTLGAVLGGEIGLKQTMTVSAADGQLSSVSVIAVSKSISNALLTVAGTIDKPFVFINTNFVVKDANDQPVLTLGAAALPNATDVDISLAMDKITELVALVRNTADAVDALATYTPVAMSTVASATGDMRSYAKTLAGIVSSLSTAYGAVAKATKDGDAQALATAQAALADAKAALASVDSILVNLALAANNASTAFDQAQAAVSAVISSASTAAKAESMKNTKTSTYEALPNCSNTLTASLASGVVEGSPALGTFNVSLDSLNAGAPALGWFVNTAISQSSLNDFQKYDMGEVLDTLSTAIEKQLMEQFLGTTDFLTSKDIPLLGKTLSEVLGIQQQLNDVLLEIKSDYPDTLQDLSAALLDKLGVSLKFSLDGDSLDASLYWNYSIVSRKIQLGSMNFGTKDLVFGGTLEAYLDASVTLQARIIMTYTSGILGAKVCGACSTGENGVLQAEPLVACKVSLTAKPLSGDLVLGYKGMSAPLLQVVSSSADPSFLCLGTQFVLGTTSVAGAEITNFGMNNATMRIGGMLHIQCAGMDLGTVALGVGDKDPETQNPFISSWTGTSSPDNSGPGVFNLITEDGALAFPHFTILYPAAINPNGTNQIVEDNLILDISSLDVSLTESSLFEKLRLVADGLGDTIRRAQSGMTKEFLSSALRNIPFVGNSIINAADCLSGLDKSFIEPFRKYANNAVGLNAEAVAKDLYTLLNKTGLLGTLNDCSTGVPVTWAGKTFDSYYKGIQYHYEKVDEIETAVWRLRLTGSYTLDNDANFDLGLPGLGLHSDGGIKAGLQWTFDFGFGISSTAGAFLLLSNGDDKKDTDWINGSVAAAATGDDISIALTVTPTRGSEVTGALGFLQMDATILTDDFAKSGFGLTLGVDLNDGVNDKSLSAGKDLEKDQKEAAPQISFSNLGSGLSVEASLVGSLDLSLGLKLGTGSGSFPELDANFVFAWSASVSNITGSVDKVAFTNIKFKAGTFIDNVLGPMVKRIQKILEPLQPLFDFLQMEVPVLNKLPAGAVHLTVLDLVKMYGQSQDMNFGMLDDIIALNNLAKNLTRGNDVALSLPDLLLVDTTRSGTETQLPQWRQKANDEGSNFLNGLVTNINDYVAKLKDTFYPKDNAASYRDMMGTLQSLKMQANDALSAFSTDASSSSSSGTSTSGGGGSWAFPI